MLIIWVGYLYFDIVLLFLWTPDGFILFLAVNRGYLGERKTWPKCIAPLENINVLFENVRERKWIHILFGVPATALRVRTQVWEYLVDGDFIHLAAAGVAEIAELIYFSTVEVGSMCKSTISLAESFTRAQKFRNKTCQFEK